MHKLIFCLLYLTLVSKTDAQKMRSPNIILIFMDDMGYGDLSCYGAYPYTTTYIDKLAAEGKRFTHFYAAQAVCSASRAALLTGCYPNRIGIAGALFPDSRIALNHEEETIPELLKKKGYVTGMIGKWHLGQKPPYFPLQHGFDEYLGLPYSNDMWPVDYSGKPLTDSAKSKSRFPALPLIEQDRKIREIRTLDDQAMLTGTYTDRAIRFIREHKNKPFFLYLAHNMPHVPIAASAAFKGKSNAGLWGDLMTEIDWNIGRLVNTVDSLGLGENTLIIFTSDNGPWLNFGNHAGSSGGLREGKGTAWEGGVRVPAIFRWKGKIKPGTINNQLATTMDLLPTLVKLTHSDMPKRKIDGFDISSLLFDQSSASPRKEFVYYYDANHLKAIRVGNWKLVFPHISQTYGKHPRGADGYPGLRVNDTVQAALYDLSRDPGETRNVMTLFPEIVRELSERADYWRKELGDELTGKKGVSVRPAASVL